MTPKALGSCGVKRSGAFVAWAVEGTQVVVRWRERGLRKSKAFDHSAHGKRHAKAFAQGTHERLAAGAAPTAERITLDDLYRRYTLAKGPTWRDKTKRNERVRWAYFAACVGANTYADLVTAETLDDVADRLSKKGGARGVPIVPNQVRAILSNVTRVFRWAKQRRLLADNPLSDYKAPFGKDDRALDIDEFSPDEAGRLMTHLQASDPRRWRAHVACRIAGTQGPRVNALLRSRNDDYDLVARTVRWRREFDKLGRERVQPLTRDAVAAVRIARLWRRRIGYTGTYLLPPVKATRRTADLPLGYAGLVRLLHIACEEAGVEIKAWRGMHGFRRMAARTVLELTGDINAAAEWIGDTDLRVVKKSYLKERPESLANTAALIRMPTEANT